MKSSVRANYMSESQVALMKEGYILYRPEHEVFLRKIEEVIKAHKKTGFFSLFNKKNNEVLAPLNDLKNWFDGADISGDSFLKSMELLGVSFVTDHELAFDLIFSTIKDDVKNLES